MTSEDTLIVASEELEPPQGLLVRNFRDPSVVRFKGRSRVGRRVTELILHETVTRSVAATVKVLMRRGLGVHLIVGPDGDVTQHGDLADDRLAHAGGHNGPSVGVEVVNPYYPYLLRDELPWRRTIKAPWAHKGEYVLPTPAQAEATAKLADWITSPNAAGLHVPRAWCGLDGARLSMGRIADGDTRRPGIWAHTYFHHADGAWLVLYAWLRLEAGLAPCVAYEEAARRAEGQRRVDLADLMTDDVVA